MKRKQQQWHNNRTTKQGLSGTDGNGNNICCGDVVRVIYCNTTSIGQVATKQQKNEYGQYKEDADKGLLTKPGILSRKGISRLRDVQEPVQG